LECTGFSGFPPWILPSVTVEALHFVVPIPGGTAFVKRKMAGQGPLELILGEGAYTPLYQKITGVSYDSMILMQRDFMSLVAENRGVNMECSEYLFSFRP